MAVTWEKITGTMYFLFKKAFLLDLLFLDHRLDTLGKATQRDLHLILRGTDCDACESGTCTSSSELLPPLPGLCRLYSWALTLGANFSVLKQKSCWLDFITELSENFDISLNSNNSAPWCLHNFKRSLHRETLTAPRSSQLPVTEQTCTVLCTGISKGLVA